MRTIKEINEKIKKGKAVVLTAKEVKNLAEEKGTKEVYKKVDIVTTATFSPMCSSGIFLNFGHTKPPMKFQKVYLDNVPAYGGLAAADIYLGATEISITDKKHGGSHVIYKLIKGEKIKLRAFGIPTDCYPRSEYETEFSIKDINQVYFFNPRNNYQNYNAAVNSSNKELKTYLGRISPHFGSMNFAGTGEISPLINDPYLKTIGIGTKIFFGGGEGFIAWEGTQFNAKKERNRKTGLPIGPGATLAIIADLRNVKEEFIKPVYIPGYGVSIYISIGIPIPILNEEIARYVSVRNKEIITNIEDYSKGEIIGKISYKELIERRVTFKGKKIPVRSLTKHAKAEEILKILKDKILSRHFFLTEPVENLPIYGKFENFGG